MRRDALGLTISVFFCSSQAYIHVEMFLLILTRVN